MDKELVWYPSDKEGWAQGVLANSIEEPLAKVKTSDGQVLEFKRKFIMKMNEGTLKIVDDMITLDEINEPIILNNIKQRYLKDHIYTYIGPMLVSVNPFQILGQYGEQLIPEYTKASKESTKPHLYAIAQDAYKSLSMGMSQAVIISGESGAGKTEATKIILKFLTVAADPAGTGASKELSRAILATNPILEAFGNAKTVRNNNSSRFGKFIRIMFDRGGAIVGANIDNYLLENTRIVHQAPEERNYHIFYQFVKGCSAAQREKYRLLPSPDDFNYLTNGDIEAPGIDDVDWFQNTMNGFRQLQISDAEVDELFTILAGVLHIGNIEFTGDDKVSLKDMAQVKLVCELLKLSEKNMVTSLTQRMFGGGGRKSAYHIPLTYSQAIENRDSMAKEIYSKMFNYLVARLNKSLGAISHESNLFIGVLDIYGFEIFKQNSLEQFCINYANEKLHQQFNHYMFKAEQEEYAKEGVPWEKIEFVDNAACIDLIERTGTGILAMLDEEGQVPKGNDDSLVKKLATKHKPNSFFGYDQRKPEVFVVNHFAGSVEYTINGFLNKNKNTLTADVVRTMITSENILVRKIFTDDITVDDKPAEEEEKSSSPFGARVGAKGKPTLQRSQTMPVKTVDASNSSNASKVSVTKKFKTELGALISTLASAERHYVRCIKPNDTKRPRDFENTKVLHQLRSNGVMETIRLRKAGYEQKILQDTFFYRYSVLGIRTPSDVRSFLDKYPGLWAIGNTKIFLRSQLIQDLEAERQQVLKESVILIQKYVRRYGGMFTLAKLIEWERKRREEEERKRREEEERRRREEEEKRRKEEEERRRKEEEERRKREEEERRRREEEERRQRQIEELKRQEEERLARIERERIEREERLKREEEERVRLEAKRVREREEEENRRVALAKTSQEERARIQREAEEKIFREAKERRERDLRLEEEERVRKQKLVEAEEAKAASALAEAKATFEKRPKLTKSVTSVGNHAVEAQKTIDSGKLANIRSMFGPTLKRTTTISTNKNLNLEPELEKEPERNRSPSLDRFSEQAKAVAEAKAAEEIPVSPSPEPIPTSNWNDRDWGAPTGEDSESIDNEQQQWGQNVDPWAEMNNFSPDPIAVDDPPFSAEPVEPPRSRTALLREETPKKPSVVKGMLPPLKLGSLGGTSATPAATSAQVPEITTIASPRFEEFDTTLFSPRPLEEVDPNSLPIENEVIELSFDPSLLPESKWGVVLKSPRFEGTLKDVETPPLSPALVSGEISKAIEEDRANLDALRSAPQRVRFDTRTALTMADQLEAELKTEFEQVPVPEPLDTRAARSLADKLAADLTPDPVATIRGSRIRMDTRTALRLADRYEAEFKEEVRRSKVIRRPSSVQDFPPPVDSSPSIPEETQPLSLEVPPPPPMPSDDSWMNADAINNLDADRTLDLANSLAAELEQTLESEEISLTFESPVPLTSSADIDSQFEPYFSPRPDFESEPNFEDFSFPPPPPIFESPLEELPPPDLPPPQPEGSPFSIGSPRVDSESLFGSPEAAPSFDFQTSFTSEPLSFEPTTAPSVEDFEASSAEPSAFDSSDAPNPELAPSFDFVASVVSPAIDSSEPAPSDSIAETFAPPLEIAHVSQEPAPETTFPLASRNVLSPEEHKERVSLPAPIEDPTPDFDHKSGFSEPSNDWGVPEPPSELPVPMIDPSSQEFGHDEPTDTVEDFGAPYNPNDDFEATEVPIPLSPAPPELPTGPSPQSLSNPPSPRDESTIDLKMDDINSAPLTSGDNEPMNADSPREPAPSQLDAFSPRPSEEKPNEDLDNAFGELAATSPRSEPSTPPEVDLNINDIDSAPISSDVADEMNADSPREPPPSELDLTSPRHSEVFATEADALDDAFGELTVASPRSSATSPRLEGDSLVTSQNLELQINEIDSTPIDPEAADDMNADSPRDPPPSVLDSASPRQSSVAEDDDLDNAFGELSAHSPRSSDFQSPPPLPPQVDEHFDEAQHEYAEFLGSPPNAPGVLPSPPPLPPQLPSLAPPTSTPVDEDWGEEEEVSIPPPDAPASVVPEDPNPFDHQYTDFTVPQFNPLEGDDFVPTHTIPPPQVDSTDGDASLDRMMRNVDFPTSRDSVEIDIPTDQAIYADSDSGLTPDLLNRENIDAIESENTIEEANEQTDFNSPDFDHSEFAIASYTPRHSMSPRSIPATSPRPVDPTVDATEFDMYTGETETELEREFMAEFSPRSPPPIHEAPESIHPQQIIEAPVPETFNDPRTPQSDPIESNFDQHLEASTPVSESPSPVPETVEVPSYPPQIENFKEEPSPSAPPHLPIEASVDNEPEVELVSPPEIPLAEPSVLESTDSFGIPESAISPFDFPSLSDLPEPLRPSKALEPLPSTLESEPSFVEDAPPSLPPPVEPSESQSPFEEAAPSELSTPLANEPSELSPEPIDSSLPADESQSDASSFENPEVSPDSPSEPERKNLLIGVKKPGKRGTARAPTTNPVRALQERPVEPPRETPTAESENVEKRGSSRRPPAGAVSLGMPNFAELAAQKRAKQLEESGQSPVQDESEGVSGAREEVEELKPELPSASMPPMGYGMVLPGMAPGGLAALRAKLRSSQKPQGEKYSLSEPVAVEAEGRDTSEPEEPSSASVEAPPKKKPIGGVSMFGGLGKVDMSALRGSLGRPGDRSSNKNAVAAEEVPPPIEAAAPIEEPTEELLPPAKKPPIGGVAMFGMGRVDMSAARGSLGRPGSGLKKALEPVSEPVPEPVPAPIPPSPIESLSVPEPVETTSPEPFAESLPEPEPTSEPIPPSEPSPQDLPRNDSFDSAATSYFGDDFGAPSSFDSAPFDPSAFEIPSMGSPFDLPPPSEPTPEPNSVPEPALAHESSFGDFSDSAPLASPEPAFPSPEPVSDTPSVGLPPPEPVAEPPQSLDESPFQSDSSSWGAFEESPVELSPPEPVAAEPTHDSASTNPEPSFETPTFEPQVEDLPPPPPPEIEEDVPSDAHFDIPPPQLPEPLPSSPIEEAPKPFDETEFSDQFAIPEEASSGPRTSTAIDETAFDIPPPSESLTPPSETQAQTSVPKTSGSNDFGQLEEVPPPPVAEESPENLEIHTEDNAQNPFSAPETSEQFPPPGDSQFSGSNDLGQPQEVPPPPAAEESHEHHEIHTEDNSSAWADNTEAQGDAVPPQPDWAHSAPEQNDAHEQWPQENQDWQDSNQDWQQSQDWGQPQEQPSEPQAQPPEQPQENEGWNQSQDQQQPWDQGQQDEQTWNGEQSPQQWGDDNGQAQDWSQQQYQGDQSSYDFSEFGPQESETSPPPPPPPEPQGLASIQEEPQEADFDSSAFDIPTDETSFSDFSVPSFDASTFEIPKFSEDVDMSAFDASQFDASQFDVADFEYDESQSEHQ